MTGAADLGWLLGALPLSCVVYYGVTYWPRRAPKDQTVETIRRRLEQERDE